MNRRHCPGPLRIALTIGAAAFAASASLDVAAKQQGRAVATVQTAPEGDARRGQQLFVKTGCYQCHGYEAQGASTGPKLGPDPTPFARFVSYVRKPTGDMPPYTVKVMSDVQLADVYAFVASRPRPNARPALLRPPR